MLDEENGNAMYFSHRAPASLVSLAHKASQSLLGKMQKFLVALMDVETSFSLTATNIHDQHDNAFTLIKNAKPSKVPGTTVRSRALSTSLFYIAYTNEYKYLLDVYLTTVTKIQRRTGILKVFEVIITKFSKIKK